MRRTTAPARRLAVGRVSVGAVGVVGLLIAVAGCGLLPARPADGSSTDQPTTVVATATPATQPSAGLPRPATEGPSAAPTPTIPASPSATGPSTASAPPTTYAEAVARVAAAGRPRALATFVTPTGNIFCSLDGVLACELAAGRVSPPAGTCSAGGGGAATTVGRIEVLDGGPRAVCNSDTIVVPGAPRLAYGSSAAGSITCLSETIGVTCVDGQSRQGFFLARGVYRLF